MTEWVHTALQHWALHTPHTTAVVCGHTQLSFEQLHAAVSAQALQHANAPSVCLVDDTHTTLQQLIGFLGIVQSGRCAAVCDPDWPAHIRQTVINTLHQEALHTNTMSPQRLQDTDPFYIGFTSGSTGQPKGFMRHHRSWVESFRVCATTFGMGPHMGILAPGRMSHSLFLFGMLMGLYTGAGIAVQDHFSAAQTLATLQAGHHPCLVAVPSQLILLMQWAQHRRMTALPQVRLILISGARWMHQHTVPLQKLFPNARIVVFYGASETSFIAWKDAQEPAAPDAVGRPFANVELQIRPIDTTATTTADVNVNVNSNGPSTPSGLIYVRSPMLFMRYVGNPHDPTAAVRDGDWLSVGDIGHIDAQGQLCLVGRQNRMIVTQGKNLFPEELETLLATHPHIANASVHALPDPIRGTQVVAVLHLRDDNTPLMSARALGQWCKAHTEAFKTPRQFFVCHAWPMTASGKTDHASLQRALLQWRRHAACTNDTSDAATPCLHRLS